MWDDGRLLAALAALPAEAFVEGPADDDDDELRWRRTARRLRQELGAAPRPASGGGLAPVVPLRPHPAD
ncbi:hypothetical protein [Actinoplanes sp. URMC 104]|uniref:hypothetical protein n=1 Tax=Actinoplanes sp. URMC 104 TaxID=3423409 RepID=UPI003F1D79BC